MKVKVTKKIWFNETVYDPDIEGEDIIVDYPCKSVDELPSWAEILEEGKKVAVKKADEGKDDKKTANKVKVNELPLTERNVLIQEAEAVGITGNNILSWGVDTLKAKIEAEKAKKADEGKDEE